jgi:dihydrofolate reductase
MGRLRFNIAISLDGFVAGPDQSEEHGLGVGGERLHEWLLPLAAFRELHGEEGGEVNESTPIVERWFENVGAVIMGRNMFGGGPGPWGEDPWRGWWGDEPGGKDVSLGGGADVGRQYLAAGLVDDLQLSLVPLLLGDGARLLEGLGGLELEQVGVVEAPGVTHLSYRLA